MPSRPSLLLIGGPKVEIKVRGFSVTRIRDDVAGILGGGDDAYFDFSIYWPSRQAFSLDAQPKEALCNFALKHRIWNHDLAEHARQTIQGVKRLELRDLKVTDYERSQSLLYVLYRHSVRHAYAKLHRSISRRVYVGHRSVIVLSEGAPETAYDWAISGLDVDTGDRGGVFPNPKGTGGPFFEELASILPPSVPRLVCPNWLAVGLGRSMPFQCSWLQLTEGGGASQGAKQYSVSDDREVEVVAPLIDERRRPRTLAFFSGSGWMLVIPPPVSLQKLADWLRTGRARPANVRPRVAVAKPSVAREDIDLLRNFLKEGWDMPTRRNMKMFPPGRIVDLLEKAVYRDEVKAGYANSKTFEATIRRLLFDKRPKGAGEKFFENTLRILVQMPTRPSA